MGADEPERHQARSGRTPIVLQAEAAECGLACLAMVAAAHGLRTDLPTLRRRFGASAKGATLAELVRIAGELRLGARPLRAEMEHLPALALPCVMHWDLNHFVVLVRLTRRGIAVIHDPARGVRRMSLAEISDHFTGFALELAPLADFHPRTDRQDAGPLRLLGRVSGLWASLAQIFVLATALEAFQLLTPFFLQWVVDDVLAGADRALLPTLGTGFGLLVLIQVATAALRSWAVLHLSATLGLQWLANVFAHLLRLPVAWFERRSAADVLSRFGAVQQIQQTLTTSFVEAVLDGLLVVVTFAVMLFYSRTLTAIAAAAVVVYAALRWAFFRPLRERTEEAIAFDAKRSGFLLESLRGVLAIKLFGRQAERHGRFMNLVVDGMNAQFAARRLDLLFGVLHRLLFGLERIAVVWVGALLVLDQRFSVGMLFAFIAYREQFALRVSALIDKAVDVRMLGLQAARLSDIVLAEPEPDGMPTRARERTPPRLALHGVHFAYAEGEAEVLSGLDLAIAPGESVAIVGPSGCGKTTLLKLMLGVHAPTAGEIRIDGVVLGEFGLRAWRDLIGTVMQDDTLFAGSIADNICFFDSDPDADWIDACARRASLADEIGAMPMGLGTLIGDLGASLSGGQRQRILLARALYKRPQFLFLDEATSALDVDLERAINNSVRGLSLTRVIVAHRPETIASADRVVVLQAGRVAGDFRSAAMKAPAPPETAA